MANLNKMLEKKQKDNKGKKTKSVAPNKDIEMLNSVKSIPLQNIIENKDQPRQSYDQEKLEALAKSIEKEDLIQPIIVKPDGKEFMIIAGHRRYKAFQILKRKSIPCIVEKKPRDTDDLTELALIENLQRDDLNAYEIATSIRGLEEKGRKVEDICTLTGYQKSQVYNYRKAYDRINKGEITIDFLIKKGIEKSIFPVTGKSQKLSTKKTQKVWFKKMKIRANKEIKKATKPELRKAKEVFTDILEKIDQELGGTK